jgi:hypothetical protein
MEGTRDWVKELVCLITDDLFAVSDALVEFSLYYHVVIYINAEKTAC